jgi:hypothetical protein
MKQFTKEFECGKLLVKESDHHYKLGPNRLLMKL